MNELKTVNKILEEPIRVKELKRIRELVRVNNIMGTVKSDNIEGELTNNYSVWFKTPREAKQYQDSLSDGKIVLVTIKEIGSRWSVIKAEIRKENVEIKEPTLKEQQGESKAFADY